MTSEELRAAQEERRPGCVGHPMMTFVRGKKPSWRECHSPLKVTPERREAAFKIASDLGGETFRDWQGKQNALSRLRSLRVAAGDCADEQHGTGGRSRRNSAGQNQKPMQPLLTRDLGQLSPFATPPARSVARWFAAMCRPCASIWRQLKRMPQAREVYVALAKAAIERLPVKKKRRCEKRDLSLSSGARRRPALPPRKQVPHLFFFGPQVILRVLVGLDFG